MCSRNRVVVASLCLCGAFLIVTVVMVATACSCLPTRFEEVRLEQVPPGYLEQGSVLFPTLSWKRAWKVYEHRHPTEEGPSDGYLLRGAEGFWSTRDILIRNDDLGKPIDLMPVEWQPK
jgi:hypothetical protein